MNGFACFLRNEAMIHLRGAKIPEFLQGQLTCDTRRLSASNAIMGALCNVKGRVLSDLLVVQLSDSHVVLRLRRSLASQVADTLRRYAQFSRISVELDAREDAIVGLRESQEAPHDEKPVSNNMASSLSDGIVSIQRGSNFSELLSTDPQKPGDLASRVDSYALDIEPRWAMETLQNGHYALEFEDFETFTPQALNYDLSGLVAFDKGCYTGQEIVARLHYKGQSKRRLQVLTTTANIERAHFVRDTAILASDGNTVGRCLRLESAPGMPPLLAAQVQTDHLGKRLFLSSKEELQPWNLRRPSGV